MIRPDYLRISPDYLDDCDIAPEGPLLGARLRPRLQQNQLLKPINLS
jgi:hypothetical protein